MKAIFNVVWRRSILLPIYLILNKLSAASFRKKESYKKKTKHQICLDCYRRRHHHLHHHRIQTRNVAVFFFISPPFSPVFEHSTSSGRFACKGQRSSRAVSQCELEFDCQFRTVHCSSNVTLELLFSILQNSSTHVAQEHTATSWLFITQTLEPHTWPFQPFVVWNLLGKQKPTSPAPTEARKYFVTNAV